MQLNTFGCFLLFLINLLRVVWNVRRIWYKLHLDDIFADLKEFLTTDFAENLLAIKKFKHKLGTGY